MHPRSTENRVTLAVISYKIDELNRRLGEHLLTSKEHEQLDMDRFQEQSKKIDEIKDWKAKSVGFFVLASLILSAFLSFVGNWFLQITKGN